MFRVNVDALRPASVGQANKIYHPASWLLPSMHHVSIFRSFFKNPFHLSIHPLRANGK
jgi:hypothetical protein